MPIWTRREFVAGAVGVVGAQHLPRSPQFAYVASGQGSIHVFALHGEVWKRTQCVSSAAPACIVLSPGQRTLYVANDVDAHGGLPRGTVEAFNINPVDGRLTLLDRKPMSLSASRPRHMALSPDGRALAVAAYGGGIYNVFPVAADGSLEAASGIFKPLGSGQSAAHPHTLVFDPTGRQLLSTEFGSDRISVFSVQDGKLSRRMQQSTGEGTGPGACLLHPSGLFLYAWHELSSALACYRYDAMGEAIQRISFPAAGEHGMAIHPSGRMLYTTAGNELRAWHVDAGTGKLSRARNVLMEEATLSQIVPAPNGESVFVLDRLRGSIYRASTDRATGELLRCAAVAVVREPNSLAIQEWQG